MSYSVRHCFELTNALFFVSFDTQMDGQSPLGEESPDTKKGWQVTPAGRKPRDQCNRNIPPSGKGEIVR